MRPGTKKCKVCRKNEAIVRIHAYSLLICEECYGPFIQRRVTKAIKEFDMLSPDDSILVAVSGGKDSLVLWKLLDDLEYKTAGLYIDLGITDYSKRSRERCELFAAARDLELIIKEVKADFSGLGIPELDERIKRSACAICGTLKRHLFNSVAQERGFDVLATGHNLDDETAVLFGNLMHWSVEYLSRQYPVLPSDNEAFKRKVKPLIYVSEYETAVYAMLYGIPYITEECPLSGEATSLLYKKVLNDLERKQAGAKLKFLKGFFKEKAIFNRATETPDLNLCPSCGMPTPSDICYYCRMKDRIAEQERPQEQDQELATELERVPELNESDD